ncbi:putative lanosterol synthase [Tilletiaria anomala UBC 951]|uniref:Terpene cyclase/mutase family member n=1 Tax=Tilletiaria anomala (strain ATCC 24038 / CBS 436.72 / UBC 951) TaxID=1037660 RepID=A0A066VF56_TILAU|nr:putative lanosterol synthase [Tilletiaria anomala UBC 951]KDN40342.1 putative lanosterol synthase [Tilletiaria anomala UBC 951]
MASAPSSSRSIDGFTASSASLPRTDLTRWRLRTSAGSHGRHTWHYLPDDPNVLKEWPQTDEDKYWLGLEMNAPTLKPAETPFDAAQNGFKFYKRIQASDGHWSGEYGGPMFLLPGLIIGMYATQTPIPQEWRIEIVRYLSNKANKDGGWGIHIEGPSTVFGTALNYATCRLLGLDKEHPMMVKARGTLHRLGGASGIPSWGKLWLAVLNAYEWEGMNPIPPELWLLPDWLPIHPWRWWIHTRMVYIPMGFLWGKKFKAKLDPLIEELRQELFVEPYDSIDWPAQRNNIAKADIFYPHTKVLNGLMAVLGVYDSCRIEALRQAGIRRAYYLLCLEDDNTSYQCLGPVNKMLNYVARWSMEGSDSEAMKQHREKLNDFVWMSGEGAMMTGTNGSQLWDASFIGQALVDSGIALQKEHQDSCQELLNWLDKCQIREHPKHYKEAYRFGTKGAWPFSTPEQGYVVSDCTGEGLKAVIDLQSLGTLENKVSEERLHDAVDLILTLQNPSGGFASYETINGPKLLEWINPAEVFGDIMVEYEYAECTTSAITGLLKFRQISEYRRQDIDGTVAAAVKYILSIQRADGSWLGSWGIAFTYGAVFALESLRSAGLTYDNTPEVQMACKFLLSKQMEDGGWGETYESCVTGEYVQAPTSQVVQTAWAGIALLHANYHKADPEPIKRAVRLIMSRQQPDGRWNQELIEGVFNRNCMISYPSYKHAFPIWFLGKAARELNW